MLVKATREGLLGKETASGWNIDQYFPFVALPSTKALGHWVLIRNPKTGKQVAAQVRDVGPHNEHDDNYVYHGKRPAAESSVDSNGHKTNGAGIDLGEAVWNGLGMVDNDLVDWSFIDHG